MGLIHEARKWVRTRYIESISQTDQIAVVIGVDCSGKSSFIEKHLSRNFDRLSADEVFMRLASPNVGMKREAFFEGLQLDLDTLQEIVRQSEQGHASGRKSVIDGLFLDADLRMALVEDLRRFVDGNISCYWMNTPLETCLARFRNRQQHVTNGIRFLNEEIIREHFGLFVPPGKNEGFDYIVDIKP